MILDKISNFDKYISLNKRFALVSEYIKNTDFNKLSPGEYLIDGREAYAIIAYTKLSSDKSYKLEAHRKYIDIQYSYKGSFYIGWTPLSDCKEIFSEYNPEKDVILYQDVYQTKIVLSEGLFSILLPEDAHAPLPPDTDIIKIIFKVSV